MYDVAFGYESPVELQNSVLLGDVSMMYLRASTGDQSYSLALNWQFGADCGLGATTIERNIDNVLNIISGNCCLFVKTSRLSECLLNVSPFNPFRRCATTSCFRVVLHPLHAETSSFHFA